jgi:7-keto-8-aminopelargonate synthetase-like enzyme
MSSSPAAEQKPASGPVAAEHYVFDQMPAFVDLQKRLQGLQAAGLQNPYFRTIIGNGSPESEVNGRRVLSFSNYNYLGNVADPRVIDAAIEATRASGVGVCGSRVSGGERPIHGELERGLAEFLGVEDALVYAAGHPTNVSVIGALAGPKDLIVYDQLSHDSMLQGARLSHARVQPFPHNDFVALDRILTARRGQFERVLILLEGMYSGEGDVCPLPEFVEVKRRHQAWIYVDEAHSFGTIGKTGRGICEYWDVPHSDIEVWMGTLSKALGGMGGVIAGRKVMVDYLRYSSSGFVNSVGIPAALAAAALAGLTNRRTEPERFARLQANSRRFDTRARAAGVDLGESLPESPIKPIMIGDAFRCIGIANHLFDRGLLTQPMIPPATPQDRSRLRLFVTSLHTGEQVDTAVDWTADALKAL